MRIARFPSLDSIQCLHPGALYSDSTAAPQDFFGRANSVTCPTGQAPGSAFLIVNRSANDTLAMNSTHSIKWTEQQFTDAGQLVSQTVTTWQNYVIARQWMIGVDGDGKSAALVHLQDKRQLMRGANNWQYNVRRHSGGTWSASSTDVSQYYSDSLDGGSLWTWQRILNDLWLHFPSAIRGTTPTLPYIPQQEPENFKSHGDAWEDVGRLLAMCQSRLVLDPVADTFSVVRIGAAQSGLASQVAALATRVQWDATPRQNLQLASMPETIKFFFPKYGIPTQTDAGGQTVRPYYTIEKPTNLAGVQAGSVMPYKTSFQAVYNSQADADAANQAPANDTDLQNLATELAEKIANKIDLGGERGRIIWGGIVPAGSGSGSIALGSEVASICWRDYGSDEGCVTDARTAEELPEEQPEEPNHDPLRPGRYFMTPTDAGGIPIVQWSSTPEQIGDFAEVPGTFDRVNIVKGTNQLYEVEVVIRAHAFRAGVNTTLITANLLVGGVVYVSQDISVYSEDTADSLHVLKRIISLTAGSYVQVSLTAPGSSGLSGLGRVFIRPINP